MNQYLVLHSVNTSKCSTYFCKRPIFFTSQRFTSVFTEIGRCCLHLAHLSWFCGNSSGAMRLSPLVLVQLYRVAVFCHFVLYINMECKIKKITTEHLMMLINCSCFKNDRWVINVNLHPVSGRAAHSHLASGLVWVSGSCHMQLLVSTSCVRQSDVLHCVVYTFNFTTQSKILSRVVQFRYKCRHICHATSNLV